MRENANREKDSQPTVALKWRLIVGTAVVVARVVARVAAALNYRAALFLGRLITKAFEPLTRKRRDRNMRRFFGPSFSPTEQARVDKEHHDYLARMRTEIARGVHREASEQLNRVAFAGEEHLQAALERRRGVLLISGHTGTWWLVPAALAARGYKVTGIFTSIPFPSVERLLLRLAGRYGIRVAFVGKSAYRAALEAVEKNEVLYLTFDVSVRPNRNERCRFGAGTLDIDPGPAQLALRQNMTVLQAACAHQGARDHVITFYPPDEIATATPSVLCQRWLDRVADEVRQRPSQWWSWGYVDVQEQK